MWFDHMIVVDSWVFVRRGWLKTVWSYYGAAEASAAAGAAVIRQLFYLRDHHSSLCYNLTGICCLLFHRKL